MADISMNYGSVSRIGAAAASLQGEITLLISDFKATTGQITSGWTGKGEKHFSKQCEDVLPSLNAIADVLKKYKPVISGAVSLQQATDASGAASAGGLAF